MSVKIDVDVINNILTAYSRRNSHQKRVYGIILGTLAGKRYHIQNIVYGYIFEEYDEESSQTKWTRLNNEQINGILKSYKHNYPNQVLLGGFATDSELFGELNSLLSTINSLNFKSISVVNDILLLVDPLHKTKDQLEYGVKVFKWNSTYYMGKEKQDLSLMKIKELEFTIVNKWTVEGVINSKGIDQFKIDAAINEINIEDKHVLDNIVTAWVNIDSIDVSGMCTKDDANEETAYIRAQFLIWEKYLSIVNEYLNKTKIEDMDVDLLNNIWLGIELFKPILEKEELMEMLKKDSKRNKIVIALSNLLNVQIQLTEKINALSL